MHWLEASDGSEPCGAALIVLLCCFVMWLLKVLLDLKSWSHTVHCSVQGMVCNCDLIGSIKCPWCIVLHCVKYCIGYGIVYEIALTKSLRWKLGSVVVFLHVALKSTTWFEILITHSAWMEAGPCGAALIPLSLSLGGSTTLHTWPLLPWHMISYFSQKRGQFYTERDLKGTKLDGSYPPSGLFKPFDILLLTWAKRCKKGLI